MIRATPVCKSMDSFDTHNKTHPSQIVPEIDLPNDTQLNSKLFFDSYDYQTERKNTSPALEQILVRQAMAELVQKLLLETAYLAALTRYYENLCNYQCNYQSRFALPPYSEQYPEYYPEQYPEDSVQYPEYYSEQYPQYYSGQNLPQSWAKSFAPRSNHLRHHFVPYLRHCFRHPSSNNSFNQAETLITKTGSHYFGQQLGQYLRHPISTDSSNYSANPLITLSGESDLHSSLTHNVIHNIISIARHNLGRPVWAFTKFASVCQRGYLGCAATVSELLHEAGLNIKGSASVGALVGELDNLGWHKIKISDKNQFQVGDIVYGLNGSHAHIGIITAADNDKILVCDNSSSSGTLKERSIESGGSFTPNGRFAGSLYVMRAGGT